MRAIRFLIRKEFLQIVRDKATLAQMLMIPFIQLIVLSNAATFTVADVQAVLARTAKINPLLNCFLRVDEEESLAASRASEKRWKPPS